ncbi:MAG TPA: transglutaminase domain-containing protein, partial [Bryobacteraceae bacterium]|nr:transglutaminase domain-containing protein [Bryobacteraceae bacterium]
MRRAFLLLLAAGSLFAEELPGWVRVAAALQVPSYSPKTPAVVLFQEEILVVEADGRRVMTERGVIRKLSPGHVSLSASRAYNSKSGRIRDFRAWVLSPAGKETRYGKERIIETSAADQNEYSETRIKAVSPGEDWQQNGVFAYEIVEEEQSVFTQYSYSFQGSLPVLRTRFTLTAPAGWEARGQILNQPDTKDAYSANGGSHTWELHGLPWLEGEDYGPEWHERAPRLALNFFPGENRAGLRSLKDWPDVSSWISSLTDGQADSTPAIQQKAMQLTANASTPLEKIRAIAAFVQHTTYVSVQMNLTRGGGYTPHKASQVLTKNYGDCKDKANLMKALLAAAGIES